MFQRGRRNWDRIGKIRLPETVRFVDYSGITLAGDRITVISQVSSALWLGNLAPSRWQVTGAGTSYALSRAADGSIVYDTAEGVSWIAPQEHRRGCWLQRPRRCVKRRPGQSFGIRACVRCSV